MYRYCDTDGSLISLHDCFATKMTFADGKLTLHFPEGFWIMPSHPENHSDKVVRTGEAQVVYQLMIGEVEDIHIRTITQNRGHFHITRDWEPEAFIKAVNSGRFKLEFLWSLKDSLSIFYRCWLRKPPYRACGECELMLDVKSVAYQWSEIDYERAW